MPNRKPPSEVPVGMSGDEVKKLRGRSGLYWTAWPEFLVPRQSAIWHYADCDVVLERQGKGEVYRVVEVVEKEEDE